MDPASAFNLQIGLGVIVAAIVAVKYVWPKLKMLPKEAALLPLLLVSSVRYLGSTFLVANLNFGLPAQFMSSGGYGDLIAGLIALVAALALVMRMTSFGKGVAWIYAIVGPIDFLYAVYLASSLAIYGSLGVSWLVMIIVGPIQIMTMIMLWKTLLRKA